MSISQQAYRTIEQTKLGYLSDRMTTAETAIQNIQGATTNGGGGGFMSPYLNSVPPEFINHLIFYNDENGGQTASKLELENFGEDLKIPNKVVAKQYSSDNTTMKFGEAGTTTIDFQNNPIINGGGFTDPTHLASAGGTSLVTSGTGPNLIIKGISAGTGTTITSNATNLQINAPITTLSSAGGSYSLINNGTGPTLATKGITAGSNISITDYGSSLQIDSTGGSVSLNNMGTGQSLLYAGGPSYGPNMYIKSIEAGTGITVTDVSGSQLRIDSTVTGTSLAGTGSGYQTLVYNGTAPNFQTYDVQASGDGTISIANNGNYLTWSSMCSLTDTGAGGASLVYGGTAPNHIIKPIVGGTGCTVTDMGTYIQISVP